MKLCDLVAVREFPAVVQADDIRALRQSDDDNAVHDFVGGYLGFDERSREALRLSLQSLAGSGGAFFLNGVYGSGKSHLLGLLALLSDRRGQNAFAATQPNLAPLQSTFVPRLVVHFSLDAYDAARFSLEEIFWRELAGEWQRQQLPSNAMAPVLESVGSRTEQWTRLDEVLLAHELAGVVVCIDEVSLFLSAKEHRGLQADAAFLQFLGQRARRGGSAGLWVFAALQKTVESIGDLEAYSLSQIRDRYTTLSLSLAHVPSVIEHRLIAHRDAPALHQMSMASFESTLRALPQLDFGREEWERLYPFHPATVSLLEAVVARFFSRTRSAILFCTHAIDLEANAETRILPDKLFDYLAPELEEHPDLRPLATVWQHWQESLPDIATNAEEAPALLRLMKGVLLFKIAGVAPTVLQLANALHFDAKLPGDGNYQYARVLLEKLRTRGSYLAVERHGDEWNDRYTIDAGSRVGEMARRAVQNTIQELDSHDTRIGQYALKCSRLESLPLAQLETPRSFSVFWRNAARGMQVALWRHDWTTERLANAVATLSTPGNGDDFLLLVAPPFGVHEVLQSTLQDALQTLPDARWKNAVTLWTPRPALPDEWQTAREATAQHLLEHDPQWLDNRRGRAVLAHLQNETATRESALARLVSRLLREGELRSGGHLALEAGELAAGETWLSTLEAIAEWAMPPLFPRWDSVAPRLRVLTGSNADQLCLEILRRPLDAPFFSPSLERAVRGIAEALGLAKAQQGRWLIQAPRAELAQAVQAYIGSGATLASVEALLGKSEWGLRVEQTQLLICALLRSGEIVALDGRGQVLSPPQIGMPLRRSVHSLRSGEQLESATWSRVRELFQLLEYDAPLTPSFEAQEAASRFLGQWRADALQETELSQVRLHQLRRQLHHTPAQWPQTQRAWEAIENLLHALQPNAAPLEILSRAATLNLEELRPALVTWRRLGEQLGARQSTLLQAHTFLTHPQLSVPAELEESRQQLLGRFDAGESVLEDDELLQNWTHWRRDYSKIYQEWHAAQHAPERWLPYRRLANSDDLRAAEQLQSLRQRTFAGALEIRAALSEEFDKACARDGNILHEPVCPACRLRWSERVQLHDPQELSLLLTTELHALRGLLQEDAVRLSLRRHDKATPLLDWSQNEAEAATLLPLLSDDVLQTLDEALRPRRCVTRSAKQLESAFKECRTRDDFQKVFRQWLDNGENLAEDDEIVLEN
jgi:hypothetical protein